MTPEQPKVIGDNVNDLLSILFDNVAHFSQVGQRSSGQVLLQVPVVQEEELNPATALLPGRDRVAPCCRFNRGVAYHRRGFDFFADADEVVWVDFWPLLDGASS